jgi:hypothetical protein
MAIRIPWVGGMTVDDPATADLPPVPAAFINTPRHPTLQQLHEYWLAKRGARLMPARADINPADIKLLLPDVIIWNATPPYLVRLVGDHVVHFVGSNNTGTPATQEKSPEASHYLTMIFETVVETKSPRFRRGKAFWKPERAYRDFESCFLPLSADGVAVDMILGGLKYDVESRAA